MSDDDEAIEHHSSECSGRRGRAVGRLRRAGNGGGGGCITLGFGVGARQGMSCEHLWGWRPARYIQRTPGPDVYDSLPPTEHPREDLTKLFKALEIVVKNNIKSMIIIM